MTFEQVGAFLDDVADALPPGLFGQLNGGITLLPDAKLHPESDAARPMYIMGEYCRHPILGRYIQIYYGSFIRVCAGRPPEEQRAELRRILLHEFTHHVESLAGERDLEEQDKAELARYKENNP